MVIASLSSAAPWMRRVLPFWLRAECLRLARLPLWLVERQTVALEHASRDSRSEFTHLLAKHSSPLEREPEQVTRILQRGKETNVAVAARCMDGLVVAPFQVFSYHHALGRPTRWRGFRRGIELRNGRPSAGVGGGLCQMSNALYLLALRGGMKVTERHRHGLDLFPDCQRSVPFGCGATVVYNYADLRFENPLSQPVLLETAVQEGNLTVALRSQFDPGWEITVYEVDHRFFRENGEWWRENRIRRQFRQPSGELLFDHEICHNRGRVLYEPAGEGECGAPS